MPAAVTTDPCDVCGFKVTSTELWGPIVIGTWDRQWKCLDSCMRKRIFIELYEQLALTLMQLNEASNWLLLSGR